MNLDPGPAHRMMDRVLGATPWSKQRDIVDAVFGAARTTVVRSCTGAGKTKVAADVCLAWLLTAPGRMVITTAPTGRQVQELLWKEVRQSYATAAQRGFPLGGHLPPRAAELRIKDGWLALGFSSTDPVNFQGWHSKAGTLVIIDEAVGVGDPTWDALEATLVGENDRLLALANPTIPSGRFYDLNKTTSGLSVARIHISAFDTPNVVAGRTVIPGLTTRAFIEDRKTRWGEDSAIYRARILGEFPDGDDMALAPLSWVDAAVARWHQLRFDKAIPNDDDTVIEAGLDVARLGADRSIMAVARFGRRVTMVEALHRLEKATTMKTATLARDLRKAAGVSLVRVDADGLGAGIFDRLCEIDPDAAVEIRGGRTANEPTRFVNLRSEMLWGVRQALHPDANTPIAIPPDDDLALQITSLRWVERTDGRIAVETKDEWRRRQGRGSTDELDAVAMALARGVGRGALFLA